MSCTNTTCVYEMPSGAQASLSNFGVNPTNGYGFQVFQSPGATYNASQTDRLYLANFEIVGAPFHTLGPQFQQNDSRSTIASECALWMCVQSYNSTMTSGKQEYSNISSFSTVGNSNISSLREQSGGFLWNITFIDIPQEMNPAPGINYTISGFAYEALTQYFDPLFNGSIHFNPGSELPSSDIMQAIWSASDSLDLWAQNVARSMTNVVRADSEHNISFYNGHAYQLGYDVRWSWIALPAVMVVMSFFMLVVIIVKTSRSPVHAWKGSPIALLFMNVDQPLQLGAKGRLDDLNGVERSISRRAVGLEEDDRGYWRFKSL
ncbi:hypothetical protein P7C71_g2009, partial [Lecanoromycetidae sp. Uapishka_2]